MEERNLRFTFSFFEVNIISSLKRADNLTLGGLSGAIMELIGRIWLEYKSNPSDYTGTRISTFIDEFLSKYDSRYKKYKILIIKNLRHGGAHCILPKSGVIFSRDKKSKHLHLKIAEAKNVKIKYLQIISQEFKKDLEKAIFDFTSLAKKDDNLQNAYAKVFRETYEEGQEDIKNYKPEVIFTNLHGDIHL